MYDPGSLKMLPSQSSIPLVIDHDVNRVVGSVRSFSRMVDVDGPWYVAHATVDRCPAWLRNRDTKASFEHKNLFVNEDVFGCKVVRDAIVTEVSILSPDRRPSLGCGSKKHPVPMQRGRSSTATASSSGATSQTP
jgi:hypothetical protein